MMLGWHNLKAMASGNFHPTSIYEMRFDYIVLYALRCSRIYLFTSRFYPSLEAEIDLREWPTEFWKVRLTGEVMLIVVDVGIDMTGSGKYY